MPSEPWSEPSFSLLWKASNEGNLQTVADLVGSIHATPAYISEFLAPAVIGGHLAVARYLLEQGAWINTEPSIATRNKRVDFLQLFMDYGWGVNDSTRNGDVVLPHSVKDITVVRWLLERGADPNLGRPIRRHDDPAYLTPSSSSGVTLNVAAEQGTVEVIDLLLDYGARLENGQPLHSATESCNTDADRLSMMTRLLELGIDVNGLAPTYSGRTMDTPLHRAVRRSMKARASFLLEHGADPNKKSSLGHSPLDLARLNGDSEFVDLLKRF